MKISLLRRFVVLADELHFPRAAETLRIPLASLYSTVEKLEAEVGHPLFTHHNGTELTSAGRLLLIEAKLRIAEAPPEVEKKVSAGGKAKASKGRSRTSSVKGSPKPTKRRQTR